MAVTIKFTPAEQVSMHYDSIRIYDGKIIKAMETIRRLHKDIADYEGAIEALQDRIKPLKGK